MESVYDYKVIPSSININLSKTSILGKTIINGENFYIGKNGKLIDSKQLFNVEEVATVFGDFDVSNYLNLLDVLNEFKLNIKKIKKFYYYKNKRWDLLFQMAHC